MIRLGSVLLLLVVLSLACSAVSSPNRQVITESSTQPVIDSSRLKNSALVDFYDPARNPEEDLKVAIAIAQKENKRIMLELGGDWCIWCRYLDEFYETHKDILQFRADHFILVKINVSEENMNEKFLSQFPAVVEGYPHIFILDQGGTFLHWQDTSQLESRDNSYVPQTFMAFLQKWASAN